jgi:hypothetical protein
MNEGRGDDIRRRLFDNTKSVELQLPDDRRLPCTGRAAAKA